jgi:hypothetical protein
LGVASIGLRPAAGSAKKKQEKNRHDRSPGAVVTCLCLSCEPVENDERVKGKEVRRS